MEYLKNRTCLFLDGTAYAEVIIFIIFILFINLAFKNSRWRGKTRIIKIGVPLIQNHLQL